MIHRVYKNRYIRNFLKDKILFLVITSIIMFWVAVYLVFFYTPGYTSNSKVLIKDTSPKSFITDLNFESPLNPTENLIQTQMEVLKSNRIADYLYNYIQKNYPDDLKPFKNKEQFYNFVKKKLNANNKLSTNIVNISFTWKEPLKAKEFLIAILKEYQQTNLIINRENQTNIRQYIDQNIAEIREKLLEVRGRISRFKSSTLSINLDEESRRLVMQKMNFKTRSDILTSQINSSNSSISEMAGKLGIPVKDAITGVALGVDNKNLIKLRDQLDDAMQQQAHDSIKYSPTNPKMVALDDKIKSIKAQIKDQIQLTVGKAAKSNNINIYDSVRTTLTGNLINAQSDLEGLKAEKKSIDRAISQVSTDQSKLPSKQYTLDNLMQQESNLSSAFDELKKKQIEAKIKENEVANFIVVIDKPDFPEKVSFPTLFQVILMGLILSCILAPMVSILKTIVEDHCEGIEEIEEITGKPIIGILPWLEHKHEIDEREKLFEISYENILSNLLIKNYAKGAKVLVFSSNNIKKFNSVIVYTIAAKLRKIGNSVVVLDSDLRFPTLYNDARVVDNIKQDFSNLILEIENKIRKGEEITSADVIDSLTYDKNKVALLSNVKEVQDPYDYFCGNAFNIILEKLKENFDWVLIDTATISIAPEVFMIAKKSDSFVLITTMNVTYSVLTKIITDLKNADILFIGCIIRDKLSNIKEYLEFLK